MKAFYSNSNFNLINSEKVKVQGCMIPFNKPSLTGKEINYINQCFENNKFAGDGLFSKKSQRLLETLYFNSKVLLTTSCTDALEMSAILAEIVPGDEVIMPSYTFVSTANAFVLRGAKIIFVDIDPNTMNINPELIEQAISIKTKAIVVVHYAGWSCDMDKIVEIVKKHGLLLIEDAAQAINSKFKGKLLGTFGDYSTISFHETKNIHCGEGGALIVNNVAQFPRAEIIREKGTNRSNFLRGQVDKYTWMDLGSSFLPSEFNAAFLLAQLENLEDILNQRINLWNLYKRNLAGLSSKFEILDCPSDCEHNAHLFAIKLENIDERTKFIDYLKSKEISGLFHYVPLHLSPAGGRFGEFRGTDQYTTRESNRLVRLPIYHSLSEEEVNYVCSNVEDFFSK